MRLRAGALICLLLAHTAAAAQPEGAADHAGLERVSGGTADALAEWDRRIPRMVRSGALRLREERARPDGSRDQWFDQLHRGVPVEGGALWRRVTNGSTAAVEGRLFRDIAIDPVPKRTRAEAVEALQALAPDRLGSSQPPELVVLPVEGGRYVLAYRSRLFSGTALDVHYVDAATGAPIRSETLPGPP
jgi:hypothetical protein